LEIRVKRGEEKRRFFGEEGRTCERKGARKLEGASCEERAQA
jgi:hypothetical protein